MLASFDASCQNSAPLARTSFICVNTAVSSKFGSWHWRYSPSPLSSLLLQCPGSFQCPSVSRRVSSYFILGRKPRRVIHAKMPLASFGTVLKVYACALCTLTSVPCGARTLDSTEHRLCVEDVIQCRLAEVVASLLFISLNTSSHSAPRTNLSHCHVERVETLLPCRPHSCL